MKKRFFTFFLSLFLIFGLTTIYTACKPETDDPVQLVPENTGNTEDTEKADDTVSFFWGTWVRMDNGEKYEVLDTKVIQGQYSYDITASNSNTLTVKTLGTFTKDSNNVMVCNNIPYFRKGGSNLEYTLKIVGFNTASRAAGSARSGIRGKGKSTKYKHFESTGQSDSEGTIKLKAPTVNDTQTVEITNGDETVVIPELKITNTGDYMGTVALVGKDDYNLKITGTISESQKHNGYIYGNNFETYKMVLTITNVSKNKCASSICSVESSDPNLEFHSRTAFTISTLAGGGTRTENLSISYGEITKPYVDTGITITIKNPSTDQEWNDYIPLRFFKGTIPITIAAKNPENNSNAALNGFVIYPDGNNQFFTIRNNSSKSLFVPTFGSDKSYMLVFSGATATYQLDNSTEMFYTVEPATTTPTSVITGGNIDDLYTYMTFGGNNHSETSAYEVTNGFEAYLSEGEIDYYRIKADSSATYSPSGTAFYFVDYESEKGDVPERLIVKKGSTLNSEQLPEIQCEGFDFLGWYYGDTKVISGKFEVNENLTLTAKWKESTYTIDFNTKGGSYITSQSKKYGEKVTRPENPTKEAIASESYAFAGWYTSTNNGSTLSESQFDFDTPIKSDITLYAKWTVTPIKHTVSFNSMGGDHVESQIITGGQKASKPDIQKKRIIDSDLLLFFGWYTSTDDGTTLAETAFDFNTPIESDITLYAKWNYPLTLEFIDSGAIKITNPWTSLKYSKNNGEFIEFTEPIIVETGDKISFYAENSPQKSYNSPMMSIQCTADCYLYGNIMSLLMEQGKLTDYAFTRLFNGNTHIKSHNEKKLMLPATSLTYQCYMQMFEGCTSLTEAPELPATSLANECYERMFYGCTSLKEASELPATKLAKQCYAYMFCGCTSLKEAPELPAITLTNSYSCYDHMFFGCTSLAKAPELPATKLEQYCYDSMFSGCTSLTKAPSLPAKTLACRCYASMFRGCTKLTESPSLPALVLAEECYYYMFYDCSNLRKVECLAQDISAKDCTRVWLDGVSSTGVFIKAKNMTDWTNAFFGIPSGWTVQDAE